MSASARAIPNICKAWSCGWYNFADYVSLHIYVLTILKPSNRK
jgi:hypothetical protein